MANLEYVRNIVNQKESVNEVTVKFLDSRIVDLLTVKVDIATGDKPETEQVKAVEEVLASIFDGSYRDNQIIEIKENQSSQQAQIESINEQIETIISDAVKSLQAEVDTIVETALSDIKARIDQVERETKEIKETITPIPEWVKPTGERDVYKIGDEVMYQGQKYVCVAGDGAGNNSWVPTDYGWEVVE